MIDSGKSEFELLLAHDTSKANLDYIASLAGDSKTNFVLLMDLAFNAELKIAMRASAVIERITINYPSYIDPFVLEIFERYHQFKHPGQKRNFLKLLTRRSFTEEEMGIALNLAFSCVNNPKEPIAAQAYSMDILVNISKVVPEIKPEIILILETGMENASAGWIARSTNLLKQLKK